MNREMNNFQDFIVKEARANRKAPDAYFVDWYANIRKEHPSSEYHSFLSGDGGIDLVIFHDLSLVLVQLKFCRATKDQIRAFEAPIHAWENEQSFRSWLSKDVKNRDAKRTFQKAYDEFRRRKLFLNWEFVSLSPENPEWNSLLSEFSTPGKTNVQMVSAHDLLYYFALEQTGAGYTESIEFEVETGGMEAKHQNGFRTLAFCVSIGDIIKGVRKHGKLDTLLARNVRLEIPNSSVNEDIQKTARENPESFFFGNNGIHIVTTKASLSGKLKLDQPAIINGGQTIKQLMSANLRHNKGHVLVRVTEIPKDYQATEDGRRFVGDIIFMSNNNNKMEPWNLRSNDPEQIVIAKYFHMNKIYYERKDYEWRESKNRLENRDMTTQIDSRDLASAYCCIRNDINPAKLKQIGVAPLFNRRSQYYIRIFRFLSERPQDALSLARLFVVVNQWVNSVNNIPQDFSGFGRASSHFVFGLVWRSLDEDQFFKRPFMLIPGKIRRNSCPHLGKVIEHIVRELFNEYKDDMTNRGVQQNDIFRSVDYWEKACRRILTREWKRTIQNAAKKDWQP